MTLVEVSLNYHHARLNSVHGSDEKDGVPAAAAQLKDTTHTGTETTGEVSEDLTHSMSRVLLR